jgi:hypothetical protein
MAYPILAGAYRRIFIMKHLLAASIVLVALLSAPAFAKSPFAGTWTLVSETTPEDRRTAVLAVTESAWNYVVQIKLPPFTGQLPAGTIIPKFTTSDVVVKGDTLKFKAAVDTGAQGGVVNVDYALTPSGEKLTGTVKAANGERKLTATRQ